MLSAGSAFAADDVTDALAVDDEMTIDEPLAVDVDNQIVSANESAVASDVVTKDTFNNYFNESGILANVTSNELTFSGDISDVGVDTIVLDRPIKIIGENSTITNIAIDIKSSDVVISGLTLNQNNGTVAISISNASNVQIEDTQINFNAIENANGYAINANLADNLRLINNAITYAGATTGWEVNNAVRISESNNAVIKGNKINAKLVSAAVGWAEVPAGSGIWVSSPITEGIVVDSSNGVSFEDNIVNVTYSNVVGSYDTIYAIDFKNSNDAVISGNNISSLGHTYIYGIIISGDNFNIVNNNISSVSDVQYANGIDIEGPAAGVVENNIIDVKGVESAYVIYSGMNGADVKANYTNNTVTGAAYNVFGFSLGDVESNVLDNDIILNGNYTTGIAYRGSLINIKDNQIVLNSSEVGNESIWESFGVEAVGVKVIKGNATITDNVIAGPGKGISLDGVNADVENNFINVVGTEDKDAYAIYATNVPTLTVNNNDVDYQGTTKGTGINNAVYLSNVTGAAISENQFNIELVSSYVPWFEIPAGSGNWVSFPISEGIVVDSSSDVVFDGNVVNVTYGDVVGSYDTIYAVSFKNSDNAVISGNDIVANGHTYIYGLQMNGDNFTISTNNIAVASDNYYANGIDIEGPAAGVVDNNVIDVKGVESAYAIYSGMNGADVKANYTNNTVNGAAYNIFGFSLGDVESNIADNEIALDGNYTTGVAYRGSKLTVDNNVIKAVGSNVGNLSVWESFGVENVGVKVTGGEATIVNNDIRTTGDYAVKVANTSSSVHDNYLISSGLKGDSAANSTGSAEIYNNTPTLKSILAASDVVMEVGDGSKFVAILKDENNKAIANKTVSISIGNETFTQVTDEKGVAEFNLDNLTVGNYSVIAKFDGEGDYAPISSDGAITVSEVVPKRIDTIITVDATFTRNATDFGAGERGGFFYAILTDINGNPLANKTVQIAVNGPIYNKTTDEQGRFGLQVNLAAANTYTYALAFQGDEKYNAAPLASSKLTVVKKSTSISASDKSFKSTAKTKKITVTLKTIKNAYDKKTYLKAGKKITLKINGVTYTAKINAKGQATFSIKLTKKGKFTALIKFAGDKTYKASSKKIRVTIK